MSRPKSYLVACTDDFDAGIVEIEHYFIEAGEWDLALNRPDRIKSCAEQIGQMPSAWAVGASGQHERVMTDPPCRLVSASTESTC